MASMALGMQMPLPMGLQTGRSTGGRVSSMAKWTITLPKISASSCAPISPIVGLGLSLGSRTATKGTKASPASFNLSTLSPCLGRTGPQRLWGTKKRRATEITSQYDGVLPANLSGPEERYKENGSSTTTFDNLLESPPPTARLELETEQAARNLNNIEEKIERTIFDFRFLTLFGVVGSLLGAVLCFLKGCLFVAHSYQEYFRACFGGGVHTSRVILYLVEAVDVYLMGTVMLIFGMGLYELFVSSLEVPGGMCRVLPDGARSTVCGSNLFGLFRLRQRPKWLEIRSLDELKTKLGHVIVMILLVGMFEKSKKVIVHTSMDFLCFSASILLSSGALYLLSILHHHSSSEVARHA
ncbi:unnamed protein product [Calypogeia fissa]